MGEKNNVSHDKKSKKKDFFDEYECEEGFKNLYIQKEKGKNRRDNKLKEKNKHNRYDDWE